LKAFLYSFVNDRDAHGAADFSLYFDDSIPTSIIKDECLHCSLHTSKLLENVG